MLGFGGKSSAELSIGGILQIEQLLSGLGDLRFPVLSGMRAET